MTFLYGSMTFISIRCSCSPITTVLHNRLSSRSSSAVYSGIDSDSWPESLLAVGSSGNEAQSRAEQTSPPQLRGFNNRLPAGRVNLMEFPALYNFDRAQYHSDHIKDTQWSLSSQNSQSIVKAKLRVGVVVQGGTGWSNSSLITLVADYRSS